MSAAIATALWAAYSLGAIAALGRYVNRRGGTGAVAPMTGSEDA